jgi:hypothetical protein
VHDQHPPPSRRGLVAALAVGAAVVAIVVPALLAERHRPDTPAAASLPTPFAVEQLTSEPQASTPANPPGVKGIPSMKGCPVETPRLLDALRASKLSAKLTEPGELGEVDCFAAYALARTGPHATVIFRYTEKTDTWRAASVRSSDGCDAVPADVRAHLQRCG